MSEVPEMLERTRERRREINHDSNFDLTVDYKKLSIALRPIIL